MERENDYWPFIEKYLPDYYTNDLVLKSDILWRYVENDDVDEADVEWIEKEFANKKEVYNELIVIETQLFESALRSYFIHKVGN